MWRKEAAVIVVFTAVFPVNGTRKYQLWKDKYGPAACFKAVYLKAHKEPAAGIGR
jgi:hypothetical protein